MKGLTMVQCVNLNQNYRSVVAHGYSALSEKAGPVLLPLVGFIAGRLAGRQTKCRWILKFLKFFTGQTILFLLPLILFIICAFQLVFLD